MLQRFCMLTCTALSAAAFRADGQVAQGSFPGPAPMTAEAAGPWATAIVDRIAQLLATPAQWDHTQTGKCPLVATAYSINCAINKAVEEGAGRYRERGHSAAGSDQSPTANCRIQRGPTGWQGSCGELFDEVPVITVVHADSITSGRWKRNDQPIAVWSGTTADAESPVNDEAAEVVGMMSTKKYADPLVEYNNDSTTTFAEVQRFVALLKQRVAARAVTDLPTEAERLEIEIYPDGTGAMRMYNGWFPVSRYTASDSLLQFQLDTVKQVLPSPLDREILVRAAAILSTDSVWNRADNRRCPDGATTWSIYCAVERAEVELAGTVHHRRPAMELVRAIVDERTVNSQYRHRAMDYNNDPTTTMADVQSLFAEAIRRISPP